MVAVGVAVVDMAAGALGATMVVAATAVAGVGSLAGVEDVSVLGVFAMRLSIDERAGDGATPGSA